MRPVEFVKQPKPGTCFPTAVYNACLFAGKKPPDLRYLIDLSGSGWIGSTIFSDRVIDAVRVRFRKALTATILARAGLLTIWLPGGRHSVFCYCVDDDTVALVNAKLPGYQKTVVLVSPDFAYRLNRITYEGTPHKDHLLLDIPTGEQPISVHPVRVKPEAERRILKLGDTFLRRVGRLIYFARDLKERH